jgi:flagellar motor switch protein FliG
MSQEMAYNNRMSDLPAYQGKYFTGGALFPDAIRKILPLVNAKLKQFSRKKIREFAGNFAEEMDKGEGIRSSLRKSATRSVKKILTGGKRKNTLKAKKPKRIRRRCKIVKRATTKDFLS